MKVHNFTHTYLQSPQSTPYRGKELGLFTTPALPLTPHYQTFLTLIICRVLYHPVSRRCAICHKRNLGPEEEIDPPEVVTWTLCAATA